MDLMSRVLEYNQHSPCSLYTTILMSLLLRCMARNDIAGLIDRNILVTSCQTQKLKNPIRNRKNQILELTLEYSYPQPLCCKHKHFEIQCQTKRHFSRIQPIKPHFPRNWFKYIRPLSRTKTQIYSNVIVETPILSTYNQRVSYRKPKAKTIQFEPYPPPGISVSLQSHQPLSHLPKYYPNLPSSINIFIWTAHAPRRFLVSLQPHHKPKSQHSPDKYHRNSHGNQITKQVKKFNARKSRGTPFLRTRV